MANLHVPSTFAPPRNNLLHPEDAERPKDPLPPPPRRSVAKRTMRPSSPIPVMKWEKLPRSLPPIGTRATSPHLVRNRKGETTSAQPPPSTANRYGMSRSQCQLTLISESEDEPEHSTENLSVRGAVSCPNSPLLGRRAQQQRHPSNVLTQGSFNKAFAYNTGRDIGEKGGHLHSNNNSDKTDNDQNNKTNTNNERKFILPEIIVQ